MLRNSQKGQEGQEENQTEFTLKKLISIIEQSQMQQQPRTYNALVEQLNHVLLPHGIHTNNCDIFEETLLSLAGVENRPEKSQFAPVKNGMMVFRFTGLKYEDAILFLTYCQTLADSKKIVSSSYDKTNNTADIILDLETAHDKLLPAFKTAILTLPQEELDRYASLCADHDTVKDYNLLQSILTLLNTAILMGSDSTKTGMLKSLNFQLTKAIDKYREHQLHSCDMTKATKRALIMELNNFAEQYDQFSVLQSDADISAVMQRIVEFFKLQRQIEFKAIFGGNIVSTMNSTAAAKAATTDAPAPESAATSSPSGSQSPLGSLVRLFATPRSPSSSPSASTVSVSDSQQTTSTELVSSFDNDSESSFDDADFYADESNYILLRKSR